MSTHDYSTIWINTNPTCLLNGSRFLNRNTTHLLNWSIVLTCLSDFIQKKKILVMNFSKMKMKFCNSVIISNAREVGKLLISPSAWCTLQGYCQMHRCVLLNVEIIMCLTLLIKGKSTLTHEKNFWNYG